MPSEAQRVAKLLAVSVGVRYAIQLAYMRQQTTLAPLGSGRASLRGGHGSPFWPGPMVGFARQYDPTSEFAIMASIYFIGHHADLLDKDTPFWNQVIDLLIAWYGAQQFPKWVKAAFNP